MRSKVKSGTTGLTNKLSLYFGEEIITKEPHNINPRDDWCNVAQSCRKKTIPVLAFGEVKANVALRATIA